MNGYVALRVIAYVALGIGIGILLRPAWGFIAFGVLVLIDAFAFGRNAPAPPHEPDALAAGSASTDPE